ncbi:MAG: flagellar biosynthetic protein FliO, partial [Gemmatimonadota bacterium]|nr:flagellar biosynthetic protein FliO [Gemmatimonadota bacterium]
MLIATLGVVAALAFVLGLGALSLWALKRVGAGALASKTRVPLEVVQRIPLGPKTGLAVVRVGERVMALSVGDGGVRQLFELDEVDRQRVIATSTLPVPMMSSAAATAAFSPAQLRAALPGKFGAMFRRSFDTQAMAGAVAAVAATHDAEPALPIALPMATPAAAPVVVLPFSPTERCEVPGFLTAPATTRRGDVLTYAPRAAAPADHNLRPRLGLSLGGAARVATVAAMLLLSGASSLRAQAAPPRPPAPAPATPAAAATSPAPLPAPA